MGKMKFILDNMFGKLAKFLRVAGYDTVYVKHNEREKLIPLAVSEQRVIITKDSKIKSPDTRIYFLTENNLNGQIKKAVKDFKLDYKNAFTLCVECNKPLVKIPKESIKEKVPERVFSIMNEFYICENCGRVFWHGTHYDKIMKKLREFMDEK